MSPDSVLGKSSYGSKSRLRLCTGLPGELPSLPLLPPCLSALFPPVLTKVYVALIVI